MPVFVLLGPEEGEKQLVVEKEKKKIRSEYPDAEFSVFFGGDSDEDSFISTLSQSSLFSSYRFIVLKHFECVKKTDKTYSALVEFGKNPQDDVTLIILSDETNKTTIPKEILEISGSNTIIYWELKEDQKKRWIINKCKEQGYSITDGGINEILDSVDNNTSEMKNVVSQLTLFLSLNKNADKTITEDSVEAYISRTKGEDGYSLMRFIGERKFEEALLSIKQIILNDSRDVIPVLSIIANSFRRLEAALIMKNEGKRIDEIFKNVTYISTYAGEKSQRVGISYPEQALFRSLINNYTLSECKDIIIYLGDMDTIIKISQSDILSLRMEELLYTIIVKKGKRSNLNLDVPPIISEPF